jgi:hypothetical protein
MKYDREDLIQTAIGVNENYRCVDDCQDLEIGFLYGTAEMIVALTLEKHESYGELRKEIALRIDHEAAKITYSILK